MRSLLLFRLLKFGTGLIKLGAYSLAQNYLKYVDLIGVSFTKVVILIKIK